VGCAAALRAEFRGWSAAPWRGRQGCWRLCSSLMCGLPLCGSLHYHAVPGIRGRAALAVASGSARGAALEEVFQGAHGRSLRAASVSAVRRRCFCRPFSSGYWPEPLASGRASLGGNRRAQLTPGGAIG
jgi:hypothetical protein